MTIIAYCHETKRVYVDSKVSWTNGRPSMNVNKIGRFTHEGKPVTYTQSGSSIAGNALLKALLQAIDADAYTLETATPNFDGVSLFVAYRNKVWFVEGRHDKNGKSSDIICLSGLEHDVCAGSGGGFYSAYRAIGMSVRNAIVNAARFNVTCGLPIRCFDCTGDQHEIRSNDEVKQDER